MIATILLPSWTSCRTPQATDPLSPAGDLAANPAQVDVQEPDDTTPTAPPAVLVNASCAARCITDHDCCMNLPNKGTCLRISSMVCVDGACSLDYCGTGTCNTCIEEDGELRCTDTCTVDQECGKLPPHLPLTERPGDRCIGGRCRRPAVCDPSWCNGSDPLSFFKKAACIDGKCTYVCAGDDDCVYQPHTPWANPTIARCVAGVCRMVCDPVSCSEPDPTSKLGNFCAPLGRAAR